MTHRLDLTMPNRASEVARIQDQLERFAAQQGISGTPLHRAQLALEEHLTNILRYAFSDDAEHQIAVCFQVDEGFLRIEIADDGRPFNPLEYPTPDLSLPIEQRPIGGLGIHMLRTSMDHLEYKREQNRNILVMAKRV